MASLLDFCVAAEAAVELVEVDGQLVEADEGTCFPLFFKHFDVLVVPCPSGAAHDVEELLAATVTCAESSPSSVPAATTVSWRL